MVTSDLVILSHAGESMAFNQVAREHSWRRQTVDPPGKVRLRVSP